MKKKLGKHEAEAAATVAASSRHLPVEAGRPEAGLEGGPGGFWTLALQLGPSVEAMASLAEACSSRRARLLLSLLRVRVLVLLLAPRPLLLLLLPLSRSLLLPLRSLPMPTSTVQRPRARHAQADAAPVPQPPESWQSSERG